MHRVRRVSQEAELSCWNRTITCTGRADRAWSRIQRTAGFLYTTTSTLRLDTQMATSSSVGTSWTSQAGGRQFRCDRTDSWDRNASSNFAFSVQASSCSFVTLLPGSLMCIADSTFQVGAESWSWADRLARKGCRACEWCGCDMPAQWYGDSSRDIMVDIRSIRRLCRCEMSWKAVETHEGKPHVKRLVHGSPKGRAFSAWAGRSAVTLIPETSRTFDWARDASSTS